MQSSNILAQMNAAVAGAGICVLPDFLAAREPSLVCVLPDQVALTRSFWLIVHADLKDVARVRAIVEFLVRETKANRAAFLGETPSTASAAGSSATASSAA